MEKFSLEIWLEDKSRKVVTRDGRPVRIICWDKKDSKYPIVGLVTNENGLKEKEGCCSFAINGKAWGDACYDLFFADEEEELTDFESDLFTAFSDAWQQYLLGESVNVAEWAKEHSKGLLESARKEILKDLPKWKKCVGSTGPFIDDFRGEDYLYLKVSELFEKLPKEE